MRPRSLILAGLVSALPALPQAPTPQKVIDEYLRAQGGAKRMAQIRSAKIAGSLTEEGTGKTGSFSVITKAPNRYYSEILAGTDHVVEAYNGMSAWGQLPEEGVRTLTGKAAKDAEAAGRYRNSRLVDVKRDRIGVEALPMERVRGRDAYHLKVTLGPGMQREVFFDTQTHLIVRETVPAAAPDTSPQRIDYDDYRPVDGVQTPYRMVLRRGDREYKIAVTQAEFNGTVENSVFDFPSAKAAPLPDMKALILEVTRNQKAVEEMQKQYTCHLISEEEKVDSKGKVASKTVKEFEVFYLAGDEVRRLVKKDGKELAGDEKKKEDERFNKQYEKLQKQAEELARDPRKQQKQAEKEEATISDILRVVRFSNARRERFRGQDVIAVDFGPNPEYKPKKAIESVVQKTSGVVWIDEQARDVARVEAHFTDTAKIGMGLLAALDKGSSLVFEQAKVNDEVWLPSYTEIHATGRFLVVKVRENGVERYTDYRKFSAESKIVSVKEK